MGSPRKSLFAVLLLSAVPLAAQTQLPAPVPVPAFSETLTTAIAGFTSSQTAQLNVLNNSPASLASLVGCQVQLAFYDSQGHLLKQGAATTVAPGAAASLTLSHSDVPAAAAVTQRLPIRGQVKTVTPSTTAPGTTAIVANICALFASLEIYDNATGVTQVFTTDTRIVFTGDAVPLALGVPALH